MRTLSQRLPPSSAATPPPLVLVIVCAGVVLASLDLFIVNVALPDMAATSAPEPRPTSPGS